MSVNLEETRTHASGAKFGSPANLTLNRYELIAKAGPTSYELDL